MQAGRRWPFFLFFLALLLTTTGCRNRTDLLENELRSRDQLYRDTLEEQRKTESRLLALQKELEALRKGAKISPELAAQTFGLKRIALGRATGGFDLDGTPGDEVLQVVVEPRDQDDHTIKAPGCLSILALETTPQGVKFPLCTWDIPAERVAQSWKQGLLSNGYTISLPWKTLPICETVRVIVRFITPDQRVFEADKDIKVRLVPGALQQRNGPPPDTLPFPRLLPMPDPAQPLVPTAANVPHETQWQLPSLRNAIVVGSPVPMNGRATPPLPPSIEELRK